MNDVLSIIPIGGVGDVTKNMYVYEYQGQQLIVDCGLGFADETMLGVDLTLPDISYLLKNPTNIVGMVLTHGHEDHIGALPFVLPQLPKFPIFASPFTAALANEKLSQFNLQNRVKTVPFEKAHLTVGPFTISLIHVTHSVPDTSHIFIETPVGNFYHGSDFKFDDTPQDGKKSDYTKIQALASKGVRALLSDCLGSEREGRTPTEAAIQDSFANAIKNCQGKFIVTTYSSNVARLNQIIAVSQQAGRKVCFVGRSLIKVKDVAKKIGYLQIKQGTEVALQELKRYHDRQLTLIIAGSQGQESSSMTRVAMGEHREVKLAPDDLVVFSADPIPGNEVIVYELIDTLTKRGIKTLYTPLAKQFHVSGHGSMEELIQLIKLTKPQKFIPIGGAFRHMFAYQQQTLTLGYRPSDTFLLEDGQEVIFDRQSVKLGRMIPVKNILVDEISGEEIESFVLRDRQKLSEAGIVVVLAEIDVTNGQLADSPTIIVRGFASQEEMNYINKKVPKDLQKVFSGSKGRVTNLSHIRRHIGDVVERRIFQDLKRRPLVLPIVIEV